MIAKVRLITGVVWLETIEGPTRLETAGVMKAALMGAVVTVSGAVKGCAVETPSGSVGTAVRGAERDGAEKGSDGLEVTPRDSTEADDEEDIAAAVMRCGGGSGR